MKKLESLKGKLFEKKLSTNQLRTTLGGITLTGCSPNPSNSNEFTCTDIDGYPPQQSLSAL